MPRSDRPSAPLMALLFGAVALFGVGCAGTPTPTFQVIEAEITDRTEAGAVITFNVEARNSGDDPLPVREVQYSLDLGGRRVFNGTRIGEVTLPRRGVQFVTLPVPVQLAPGEPALSGDVSYRLAAQVTYVAPGALGEALFDVGVRRPKAKFARSGILEFGPGVAPVE